MTVQPSTTESTALRSVQSREHVDGWFFWGPRGAGVRPALTPSGRQETTIVVKGAYAPNVIIVEDGKPVPLNFPRQKTAARSEEAVFSDFHHRAQLPEGELVPVGLNPGRGGDYAFPCGMGVLRGKGVAR